MNAIAPTRYLVPERVLIDKKVERAETVNMSATFSLEGIRDYLAKADQIRSADYVPMTLRQTAVEFVPGTGCLVRFVRGNGPSDPLLLSTAAFRQMASYLLPAYAGGYMLKSLDLDERSAPLVSALWAIWSQHADAADKPLAFRTQWAKVDGAIERLITGVVSEKYAPYSNLQLANALLDGVGNMPLVQARITDTKMRLKAVAPEGGELMLDQMTPTYDLWNSETGHRSVGLRAGLFTWRCTNGMGSWGANSSSRWNHVGDVGRISRAVPNAIDSSAGTFARVAEAYGKALDIYVGNAQEFAAKVLADFKVSQSVTDRVVKHGLVDPTSSPLGTLAGVVDGITLIAQQESMEDQELLEQIAADVLRREVAKHENRVLVEA